VTKKIDEVLAEDGAAAEDYELPEVLPEGVEVRRPHVGRATVVSVRLSPGELEQLTRAAQAAHLPVSTLIRVMALAHVDASEGDTMADVTERLARLESAVFDRSA
jgi:hypothetical protein